MAYNRYYIERYEEVLDEYKHLGIEALGVLIAKYEFDKKVDSKKVKDFLVKIIYSDTFLTESMLFEFVSTFGARYNMSAAEVLLLASMRGAYDEIVNGSTPGIFSIQ